MTNNLFQVYSDYLTTINNQVYNTHMTFVKSTQEFVTEVVKNNPYKDAFGIMETFSQTSSKQK
jgi:hypothetical protein